MRLLLASITFVLCVHVYVGSILLYFGFFRVGLIDFAVNFCCPYNLPELPRFGLLYLFCQGQSERLLLHANCDLNF